MTNENGGRNGGRDPYDWATEKEPSFSVRPRPIIPLSYSGTVKNYIARLYGRDIVSRCTTCSKPTAGVRCRECQEQDARSCGCGCYTVAGERECTACGQGRAA